MIKGTFIDVFEECKIKGILQPRLIYAFYGFNYAEILWHLIVKTEIPTLFTFLNAFVM